MVKLLTCMLMACSAMLKEPTVAEMTSKLEKVEQGFSAILKTSPAMEDLLKPMLAEIEKSLNSEKSAKEAALKQSLGDFPEWQKKLSERQEEIANAGDEQRTSLLVAVLQNKQSLPVSEQLEVVNAPNFDGLKVVDYVNEHHDSKTPLVQIALKFLDGESASPAPAVDPNSLDGILAVVKKHAAKAHARVEMTDAKEARLEKAFTKLNNTKPEMKFLKRKEERKIKKERAVEEETAKALDDAIVDIEHKDPKGLIKAKDALTASMQAMQDSQGVFLHLLQIEEPGFACPYCGAQCIEKCHSTEHKSMSACLTECIAKNPTPGSQ